MKKLMLTVWFLSLFLSVLTGQTARDGMLREVASNFENQLAAFAQEKIYVHTDRNVYVPGEKIWFKAYVADAATHIPVTASRYVYVELISAADTLINRVMVRQTDGMFYGYLPLNEIVPEGDYTLRAYTGFMENIGDDYFFKKNIRIGSIDSSRREPEGNGKDREIAGQARNDALQQGIASQARNDAQLKQHGDDYDVSFFPEGGNLIEGAFCKVAFKALRSDGTADNVSGEIVDERGTVITLVETYYAGMGAFSFIPANGKTYRLKCRNSKGSEKQFELPQSYPNACALTVLQRNKRITIEVRKSVGNAESPHHSAATPCYLLGHCRGMVFHFTALDNLKEPIAFSEKDLPDGVLQFVLFDGQMNPLSERLVFNKTLINENLEFQTDKPIYEKREKATATLKPLQNPPKEGQSPSLSERAGVRCSISVTDDKDCAVDSSTTILSTLLLSSELKGYIENPSYYLQDNLNSIMALDLLMLTHGWRRYDIPEVVKGSMQYPQIPYQTSQTITGSVKSPALGKPLSGSELLIMADEDVGFTTSDEAGKFRAQDFEYPDSTTYFIQALSAKGSKRVELVVDEEKFPQPVYAPQSTNLESRLSERETHAEPNNTLSQQSDGFFAKAEQRSRYDEDMRMVYLDEVVVSAPRIEQKDESRLQHWANRYSHITIRKDDVKEKNPQQITDMLRGISGMYVNSQGDLVINGILSAPIVLINGVPIEWPIVNELPVPANSPSSPLMQVSVYDVESIDIIKGVESLIFGVRGGVVISITTTTGLDAVNRANRERLQFHTNYTTYTPLGYQKPVEFYSPKYETSESKQQSIPDYRTTIYWKPDLKIDEETGEASFDFYTADFPTTYSVVIEGLTNDGRIIRQVEKIRVE
ncbi:MAG: TonB-dependent receptor plug domain-containing protein [Tannerella sp.]|jgi:hypothetical protein|nr:TonB-dependent receptor plug domain-containing protein [Tannerella sp.]